MASLAEKLASNITFDDFKKATDLKHRLFFTLLILILYRLGSFIPLPGIDASIVKSFFDSQTNGGILSMLCARFCDVIYSFSFSKGSFLKAFGVPS